MGFGQIVWAAVVSFVFGYLWYSPALFGNMWMKLNGVKPSKRKAKPEKMHKKMIISFIGSLITAYVVSILSGPFGVTSFPTALEFGFFVWLGFIGSTTLLGSVIWDNKPMKLWFLNSAYWFLNITLIATVLL